MAASSAARSTPVWPPEMIFMARHCHSRPRGNPVSKSVRPWREGGTTMPLLKTLILGFIAGFLSVLIFHQSLWYVLNLVGLTPPDRPAWPLDPTPPYGVPSVISKAFWGGVWGAVLAPMLGRFGGRFYWTRWILVGSVALTLVAFFVVPPIKGEPIPELWPRFLAALLVNAAWGFGTALFLRLPGGAPR